MEENSKCAVSRKIINLYRELENVRQRYIEKVDRYTIIESDTIPFHEISQQKYIPNFSKLSQEEKILVHREIHKTLNKGAIVETRDHLEGEFISNLFLVEKKDEGNRPVINLKTPKSVYTLPALQDGWFAQSSKHSKEGRLHVQTGFEGFILFSTIKSSLQKFCSVSLVRETLRVSLPLFWTRPSNKNN